MDNIVSPEVYEIIKNIVDEDIENFSISVHKPNKKGEGYLGQMCFLSLRDKNSGKLFNFVVKQAFEDDFIRGSIPIRNVFLNEIYFYNKLWPCLQNFKKKIPALKDFDKIPKCFATTTDECSEKLVLENIKQHNFQMFDKRNTFDKNHIEFIFKQYGKFHALSFAYRTFNPESYCDLTKDVKDIFCEFMENKPFRDSVEYILDFCLKSLQPGKDDELIEKYKHYIENGVDKFNNSNIYTGRYSVIIHGDCWSNNMMFKYDEFGKLVDMRLLDFQLIKDGTPVSDLSYCLYSGASKDILDELDYYLKVYHSSLSETLNEFGCNAQELYPFEELKKDWKRHCHLGFTMGLLLWKSKLTYDEEILDLTDYTDDSEETKYAYFNAKYDEDTFKERTRNLILHMYENDFL